MRKVINRISPTSYENGYEDGEESCRDKLTTLKADLAAAQSTIALVQRIAGCQVDRLAEVVEGLVKERAAALERVRYVDSLAAWDAKKLRELGVLCGLSMPTSDEEVLGVAGERIASIFHVVSALFSKQKTLTEECNHLKRERDEALLRASIAHEQVEHWLDDGGCADCEVSKKAYRQGFEDCREVALKECRLFPASVRQIQAVNVVKLAIRALTVPERGE